MFSLQAMFGNRDKVLELLQDSAEAAREAAHAVSQLTRDGDDTAVFMATFRAARLREKELAA